jgi:prolyl-tRNA synthetase
MGSYGIGPARIIAAAVEQNHDQNGMILPLQLTPFHVYLLPVNLKQEAIRLEADRLYQVLQTARIETLYDDRDEAPGVKFKDADLLGIPLRLTLSAKTIKESSVEVKIRQSGMVHMVKLDQIIPWVENWKVDQQKRFTTE